MKKAIIIPVYLRLKRIDELPDLEGVKLTKRAIGSLRILKDQDFTLLLPVCFDLVGEGERISFLEMDKVLREELKNFEREKMLIFSSLHLEPLRKYFEQREFKNFYSLIGLNGFSKIRNTGLLLAQALSLDVAIFIDNDEVVEDINYLEIACQFLAQMWNGKVVSGKGGFYLNPDGTILLPPQRLWWRCLWNKTKWMNQVWEEILSSKDRLVFSPLLLGGNLALHRFLFSHVPFDPHIPRGEDTDYLINASRFGFILLFDKALKIKHLHPERTEGYYFEGLKGDIERFLYERQKVKTNLSIDLDPYPGYFLKQTLYAKAALTSLLLGLDYFIKAEWKKAFRCIGNLSLAFRRREEGWVNYLKFKADWEKMMGRIRKEGMNEILEQCWI